MKAKTPVQVLKEWWWLYGVLATLVGGIVLWGSLPGRVAKAEQQIDDLKGWAKELQGYTRAQQEYNQQQQQQQMPNAPVSLESPAGLREWEDTDQTWWCCPWQDRQQCYDQVAWRRCP